MIEREKLMIKSHNNMAGMTWLILFVLMASSSIILVNYYLDNYAFGQIDDKANLVSQSGSSPGQLTSEQTTSNTSTSIPQAGPPTGFVAKGTINSVINVPNGKWIAVGNWSMTLNNGNITVFGTNMTWYDSNATTAHTHELVNFSPVIGEQVVSMQQPSNNNNFVIRGTTDVGTNGRISWTDVPTTININGRKIVAISVDDNMTNHHFAKQPVLGIVSSFVPCSDLPGPDMEVLPPCSADTSQASFDPSATPSTSSSFERFVPTQNATSTQGSPGLEDAPNIKAPTGSEDAPGVEGSLGSEDAPNIKAPTGSEDAPASEDAPGIEQQSEDAPNIKSSSSSSSGQTEQQFMSGPSLAKTSSPGGQQAINATTASPGTIQGCEKMKIKNVTSNGFESDPSDYHPPYDAVDGNSSTWWSNQGENSWLKIDLGHDTSLCEVLVEWNKGDERNYTFEISTSKDGNDFEPVFDGTNQEGSSALESYKIEDAIGRYVTLTVTGSSSDKEWVSVKEIGVIGSPVL